MKSGWLITRNSKHVKEMPITTEQCLRYQLSKERETDTLEDIILRHFEDKLQDDKNNTHAETNNNVTTYPVPVIDIGNHVWKLLCILTACQKQAMIML